MTEKKIISLNIEEETIRDIEKFKKLVSHRITNSVAIDCLVKYAIEKLTKLQKDQKCTFKVESRKIQAQQKLNI